MTELTTEPDTFALPGKPSLASMNGGKMSDTYESAAEAAADRAQQQTLLAALSAWDRALRRDECGAWRITGNAGSIHTWGDGKSWVLFVVCRSARHWTAVKAKLRFCTVTQDGDYEGCLRLRVLPRPEQAAVLRDVLGIRKRIRLDPETLERLSSFAFERKPRGEATLASRIGKEELPGTEIA